MKLKLGFYFRNKACFSFEARRRLVIKYIFAFTRLWGYFIFCKQSIRCVIEQTPVLDHEDVEGAEGRDREIESLIMGRAYA
jgi:hypothetical protein